MLKPGRVGRVAGDRHVNSFMDHYGYTLTDVVRSEAADFRLFSGRKRTLLYDLKLASVVVIFRLYQGKPVDAGNYMRGIFSKSVENDSQRFFSYLIGGFGYAYSSLRGGK
ncbi:hypothetical protein SDC9_175747 [bioreactor metagenome]|uniref:Uncharacterized protein n=1 Tax=bioreactor metagenome TaxID=1076179 RepID=A0A645GQ42_9ZZZZ